MREVNWGVVGVEDNIGVECEVGNIGRYWVWETCSPPSIPSGQGSLWVWAGSWWFSYMYQVFRLTVLLLMAAWPSATLVPAPSFSDSCQYTQISSHYLNQNLPAREEIKVKLPVKITLEYTYCCYELRDLTEIHHVSMLTPGTDIQLWQMTMRCHWN